MNKFFKSAGTLLGCGVVVCAVMASSVAYSADELIDVDAGEAETVVLNGIGLTTTGIQSIKLPSSIKIGLGNSSKLDVSAESEDSTDEFLYESSSSRIVTVDENGIATGHAFGTVVLTVTVKDHPDISAQCNAKVVLPAPEDVKVTGTRSGNGVLKVSWNEVTSAKKYQIYRKKKGGSWTKLTSTTSTTYTDKNTKGGTTYSYRIRAVASDSKYNSAYSEKATAKIPTKPYGTMIASISDAGIEYYWKKPDNIDGYVVYRSYSKDGKYSKLATINDAAQGTYVDSKFDHSLNSVYYKVRSFTKTANGKIYSKYSPATQASYRYELKLSRSKLFVRSNASRTLEAYYGWGNASSLNWYSSDESVATVSSDGVVTGISAGTCTIRCYSSNLGVTKTCKVTVDRSPLSMLKSTKKLTREYTEKSEGYWVKNEQDKQDDAVIMMVGDLMCTGAQQGVQGYSTGDYNFNESFDEVKDTLRSADLAVGNLETTLSSTWPYMHEEGYVNNRANCNAPNRYLDAVLYAGFDGVVTANNHNCDADVQGLKETLEQVNRYSIAHTGTFSSSEDTRYMIFDVNGIKVGYVSYVTEVTGFNGKDASWTKNQVNTYLNYYSKEKAQADLQAMKDAGADYTIAFMHWGIKNAKSLKPSQKEAAQELADMGFDYLVGSHPHLLQPYTTIKASDGREVPCFYSLGDFQASVDQIAGNRDSAILRIRLQKDSDGNIILTENNYIPCYTYTKYRDKNYVTVEVKKGISDYDTIHDRIKSAIGNKIKEY